ncbi:MAG: hypothetical protein JKY65_04970 [Planctomycetes bacterium]|nr:hypothetical protein [Planctomycetota bacterium]
MPLPEPPEHNFDRQPVINDRIPEISEDFRLRISAGSNHLHTWFLNLEIGSSGHVRMQRGNRSEPEDLEEYQLFWNEQALSTVIELMEQHDLRLARSVQRPRQGGDHLHLLANWEGRSIDVWVDGEFEEHVCPFVSSLNRLLPDSMQISYTYLDDPCRLSEEQAERLWPDGWRPSLG